jgi:Kef-type K+ transport system membrane component KefB
MFQVGLESTVAQMLKVGWSSLWVACLGVVAPFALGWGVGAWLLPKSSTLVHAFLGATLSATSVAVTARVLQDLKRSQTKEARIILGAAVIDDVLGLVLLAVVTAAIHAATKGTPVSYGNLSWLVFKALIFVFGALVLGIYAAPRIFSFASKLHTEGVLLALALSFCFFFSWLANLVQLAPIVGAFAAGLVLEDFHFKDFVGRGERHLEDLLQPIVSFLIPVFFVLMGMRTDLLSFANWPVLGLTLAITAAAILGKLVCGFGVTQPGLDRLSIGIGMIPRGEVGLIFANIGLTLSIDGQPIINPAVFSALVAMVIVTTFVSPLALKWSLSKALRPPGGCREDLRAPVQRFGNALLSTTGGLPGVRWLLLWPDSSHFLIRPRPKACART